jgi:hypothetical protein
VPRHVKFVDGFPMTVTGKVQKFLMRQQMIEELGLSVQETACEQKLCASYPSPNPLPANAGLSGEFPRGVDANAQEPPRN